MHLAAAAVLVLPASAIHAQVPSGYHVGSAIALPDTVNEVWAQGEFRIAVQRVARTSQERRLMAIAERLYPDTSFILGHARDTGHRARLDSASRGSFARGYRIPPRAAGHPSERWWFDDFDATWLPYALTSGAVDYYVGRLRDLAARAQSVPEPDNSAFSGLFTYSATIRATQEHGAAYVVELSMSWEYYCGMLCALAFTHRRSVWFDERGNVIRIEGDGPPQTIVS